jgi:Cys-rich protein (TIGR01571 family)
MYFGRGGNNRNLDLDDSTVSIAMSPIAVSKLPAPKPAVVLRDEAAASFTVQKYESGLLGLHEDWRIAALSLCCLPVQAAKNNAMLDKRTVHWTDIASCPCLSSFQTRQSLRSRFEFEKEPVKDLLLTGPLGVNACCMACAVAQDGRHLEGHFSRLGITWNTTGSTMTVAPRAARMFGGAGW